MQGKMDDIALEMAQLNQETARAPWRELQVFFATGKAVWVDSSLDLLEVAVALKHDSIDQVKQWQSQQLVAVVSDQQALGWYDNDRLLWTVVVKPFVLVQDKA